MTFGILVMVHCGTPCQSMSWGRLPQLRSWIFVLGLPGLSVGQQALITVGNALAQFTVKLCKHLMGYEGRFSIENPCLSWLWAVPGVRDIYAEITTAFTIVTYKDFGTGYVKPTALLHNLPFGHELWRPPVELRNPIVLRGWLWFDGQKVARTALASRYPPQFAVTLAKLMQKSLDARSAALAAGGPIPHALGAFRRRVSST